MTLLQETADKAPAETDIIETAHVAFIAQHAHPARIPFADIDIFAPSNVYHPWPQSSTHLFHTCMPTISNSKVLELGCGTGAIGLALSAKKLGNEVTLSDNDPVAVASAEINAMANALFVRTVLSDLFDSFDPDRQWDIIIFNPPLLNFAPLDIVYPMATDLDGCTAKRFIAEFPSRLRPGGRCFLSCLKEEPSQTQPFSSFTEAGLQVKCLNQDLRNTGICVQILEVKKL